jgi:hypothetical protein
MPQRRTIARHLSGRSRSSDDSIEARLGARVTVQSDGCWIYNGQPDTYGQVRLNGGAKRTNIQAHRYVYEVLRGPIPDGMHLHHECERPGCVNPTHLTPMTPGDHIAHHAALRRSAA